jgi:hypothetical protein
MAFFDFLRNNTYTNNGTSMNYIKMFLIGIFVLIVLILIINYLTNTQIKLAGTTNASKEIVVDPKTLKNPNNTNNYTYSMWMYINDWNYRYGEDKVILQRIDNLGNPTPSVKLGALENNITVSVACYPNNTITDQSNNTIADQSNNTIADQSNNIISNNIIDTHPLIKECVIRNIPIQRWTNLIISLYGRTLDIYLDGKLVRTCVLPGVPKVYAKSDTIITPNGGFNGLTSNIIYLNTASNPQEAYNIYKNGSGSSLFGSFFNKYKIRFSILDNSNVKGTIEI